ncbi:MAG: PepSY-like domain-containing protein [Bacteroidota bacterium]
MKAKIFFVIMLVAGFAFNANSQDIPKAVTDTMTLMYPEITGVKWENSDVGYVAKFKDEGTPVTVTFTKAGNWKETSMTIEDKELPSQILVYVKSNYLKKDPAFKIKTSFLYIKPSEKYYYVPVKKAGSKDTWELFFKTDGTFIRVDEPGTGESN